VRIGESLKPFWQKVALTLWVFGYAANFVLAISSIWGWHFSLGVMACIVLAALAHDDRKAIRLALRGQLKKGDRLFALYIVSVTGLAFLFNLVLMVGKLATR